VMIDLLGLEGNHGHDSKSLLKIGELKLFMDGIPSFEHGPSVIEEGLEEGDTFGV